MQPVICKSEIEAESSLSDCLNDIILKQFEEIFSKNPHLPTHQAFML